MNSDHENASHNAKRNAKVLALDVGTSSTRAILFDARGAKIGLVAQIEYSQTTTSDGGVETDADALLEHTLACIDQILANATPEKEESALKTSNSASTTSQATKTERSNDERPNDENLSGAPILAVACSCFWHSLMAIDADGNALTPLFSWADNRAAPWIPALRATLSEDDAHARTGCVFHTSYWPAKLLWLHHTRPELFVSSTRWIGFGEYLALKLCGTARASLSMASGTGIFDQNACDWDAQTLKSLPIERENLPLLCDANEPCVALCDEFAARWPLLRDAKWFPALGDGACSNVGSGCTTPTKVALNVGTSGALRVVLNEYSKPAPRGLWRYRLDRKRVLLGGALSNGGSVFAWASKNFNLPADAETQIAKLEPDSHGLTITPFLAGERSPLWNADARFSLEGASLDTTPIEILQACLEAAALRFGVVAQLLFSAIESALSSTRTANSPHQTRSETHGEIETEPALQIIASGGALAKSPVWTRIMTDCLGVPLILSHEAEASARGAALMALEACGVIENIDEIGSELGENFAPDAAHHEIYARALTRQNALYQKLY